MWIALLLFFLQAARVPNGQSPCQGETSRPTPTGPPALVVQAVDPVWMPVMGADVTIDPEDPGKQRRKETTGEDGTARFWFAPEDHNRSYIIRVELRGFKKAITKGVRAPNAGGSSPTAYVQVQLQLKDASVTVY